ncbi:asparagine synthase (glutamine-hydrolyzing) [Alloscardovia macacae]|uniref:asparagine synthase (glutamine-hydrolyzing) n=1 Tax=Alloscardovia macacae TaxID=1160091 RepID=A0A1Y2SY60_9BIFI|nr:asparagine synthase (glutamine-hydrolyzing) [Alloscardovia macacae]OTA29190.1 asparagine synthase (glutamine-hydrolyzing) [Alloscardovia macacae]
MCGIAGFINDFSMKEKHAILTDMTDRIAHRGPDAYGEHVDEHAALGFRRLSIIDLAGGDQPIYNEDKSLCITFNGEIYNYQPLREELLALGHTFSTHADTEVILHGYEQWGTHLLNRLRGMFAFVIWNSKTHELFGARDHFGIKPFYYAQMNGTFMYASEIKALLAHPHFEKELNKKALKPYLTFQYPALRETFFKGVFKLPEGHYFTYKDGQLDIHEYYDEAFEETCQKLDDVVDTIDATVQDSVRAHQIADVEVGSFLSSGVDSSYVAALARPEHTYSIGFGQGSYNESHQAQELAGMIHLNNTSRELTDEEAFSYFPQIQWYMDEPDSNPSCVPLFFLSQLAAKDVKCVLSGEGADELFAGYIDYGVHTRSKAIKKATHLLQMLPESTRQAIGRFAKGKTFHGAMHLYENLAPARENFIGQAHVFTCDEADALVTDEYRDAPSVQSIVDAVYDRVEAKTAQKGQKISELKKKQYLDLHQWMPGDILLKADKMTMAHSLELRVPLLDKELMAVAQKVPTRYLISEENTKYAFRKAAARHLPEAWYKREKLGFPVPIRQWLREEKFYTVVRSLFAQDFVREFFDQDALLKMVDDNFAGKTDDRRKIWTVYSFLTWYSIYFLGDGTKPDVQKLA